MNDVPFKKTDADWKAQLSSEAYRVTRKHGTERAFTSPLNVEKRNGMYHCTCCDAALFPSDTKFDSGSGWPSFYKPADSGNISEHEDRSLFMKRTEIRCSNCNSHLGHVFPDGPERTGLRYCINGVALDFKPEE